MNTERYHQEQSASDAGQQVFDQVRDTGGKIIDDRKGMAAHEIRKVGSALHSAAKSLRGSNSPISELVEHSAETVDRISDQVESKDLGQLVHTVQNYAHRYPGLAITGMFLGGLALSRFFKASE